MSSLNANWEFWLPADATGCMQATTFEATSQTNFKPRDKELLARLLRQDPVAEPFRRAIVEYRREARARSWSIRQYYLCLYRTAAGDPLRYYRRRGSDGVVRHRQGRQHDRVAALASYQERNLALGVPTSWRRTDNWVRARGPTRRQGRSGSRHQPAGVYRRVIPSGHPDDQRGRDRPV